MAGARAPNFFEPRALGALYVASGGIPRLVNILAHKAMMAAFGEGCVQVGKLHVKRAIADTTDARKSAANPAGLRRLKLVRWIFGGIGVVTMLAGTAAMLSLSNVFAFLP